MAGERSGEFLLDAVCGVGYGDLDVGRVEDGFKIERTQWLLGAVRLQK
jgi:hypothetical protein